MVRASRHGLAVALLIVAGNTVCEAVMFKFTDDVAYNTTAPGGALTNSGWQHEGIWSSYLGTPIAPTYFIAANHVAGTVGDLFELNGFTYHTTAVINVPGTDLNIWRVAETFPSYAALNTNTSETGKSCVVFGRGTQRGSPVIVGTTTNGWQWGPGDAVKRWGENTVAGVVNGGPTLGDLLRCAFDRGANSNECHLSTGDSSGALFIQDGSEWKLAGIHYAVDGPFSNATYGVINAALLDRGGLCEQNGTNWDCYTNTGQDDPSSFYSTRISSHASTIYSLIDFEPGVDLRIAGIQAVAGDVQISLMTGSNRLYRVDWRNEIGTGSWATLTNGVAGNGGIVVVTDPGAANVPRRFYQLRLVP